MSNKITRNDVRVLLSSLQQFILKMPQNKAQNQASSLQQLIKKYDANDDSQLNKLHKALQYKSNFLKLAYPNLANEIKEIDRQMQQDQEKERIMMKEQKAKIEALQQDGKLNQEQQMDLIQQFQNQQQEEPEEPKYSKSGTYVMKDGKLVEGEAEKRETVDFSNWYAGNVDPEDLKKHKELLDRQHFGGPVWEGKKPNPSILNELAQGITDWDLQKGETNPNLTEEKKETFDQVKR